MRPIPDPIKNITSNGKITEPAEGINGSLLSLRSIRKMCTALQGDAAASKMSQEQSRKRSKQNAFGGSSYIPSAKKQKNLTVSYIPSVEKHKSLTVSYIPSVKKQKNLTVTTSIRRITDVVTKILLDDANNGFEKGNFVCSPFSLEIVLGMLAFGAEGETLKQLLEFLGHESTHQLHSMSTVSKLLENLLVKNTGKGGLTVRIANGVWVDEELKPVKSCYQEVLKNVYKTEANYINIQNQPAQSAQRINSWVKKNTNGLIPAIVGNLRPNEAIVFANAVYFKGTWSKPFDAKNTKKKDFHLINGEKVSIRFMTSYKEFGYGSFQGYKMIELPYARTGQSNKFSMYIFLPDRKDGLQDLLQLFHSDSSLFYGDFNLKMRKLNELWIPKFEMSCTFNAHDEMKQMGLTLPFTKENKELTGIVNQKFLYKKMLYVSKILQKSIIKVDESGTEAVAATSIRVKRVITSRRPPPPVKFVADHPFMFMIREDNSRVVLFSGVVIDPNLKS